MPHARYSSNHQQNARTTSEWHEGLANIWISHCVQCESKKTPPLWYSEIFSKRLGIFIPFFTHLLHDPFYTRLQIFIQISPTLTKLCHTKCDHLANFYISLEAYLSLLTEQITSLLTSCHIRHVC